VLLDGHHGHWTALCGAVLARQMAGTPLRNPESFLQDNNSPAATFRAQKFPSANSLSMALSSSASASNRLSLLQFLEALSLGCLWPPADCVYMPP
jgi:hypothetical protein